MDHFGMVWSEGCGHAIIVIRRVVDAWAVAMAWIVIVLRERGAAGRTGAVRGLCHAAAIRRGCRDAHGKGEDDTENQPNHTSKLIDQDPASTLHSWLGH